MCSYEHIAHIYEKKVTNAVERFFSRTYAVDFSTYAAFWPPYLRGAGFLKKSFLWVLYSLGIEELIIAKKLTNAVARSLSTTYAASF